MMENAEKLKVVRHLFRDIFTNTPELSIITVAKLTNLFKVINPGGPDELFRIEVRGVNCYDQENADMVVELNEPYPESINDSYNEAINVVENIIDKKLNTKQINAFKKLFLQHESDIYGKINYGLNVDWVARIVLKIKEITKTIASFEFIDWVDLVITFKLNESIYHIDVWNDYLVTDEEGQELDA